MAKLDRLPDDATISAHRGLIDYYMWKGIPVARSWPRWKPSPFNEEQQANQAAFSFAAKATGIIGGEMRDLWLTIPTGSGVTWVDVFRNAAMTGSWFR